MTEIIIIIRKNIASIDMYIKYPFNMQYSNLFNFFMFTPFCFYYITEVFF